MTTTISTGEKWLFGPLPELQRPLKLVLLSFAIYVLNAMVMWLGVKLRFFDATFAKWLIPALVLGPLAFFGVIRSGRTRHLNDPALVLPQVLYCVVVTLVAFAGTISPGRSMVLVILPMVMMFGQFNLKGKDFALITGTAVALLVIVTLWRQNHPTFNAGHGEWLQVIYVAGILVASAHVAQIVSSMRARLHSSRRELADALSRLQALATTDELTGLPNRRRMQDLLQEEVKRHKRQGRTLCLALIDLDHFKRINDQHGHQAGDMALQGFARVARQVFREVDTVGRWGGEEFLLVLPESDPQQAKAALERLRVQLAATHVLPGVSGFRLTFSAGLTRHDIHQTVEHTIDRADQALYAAKSAGRDQTHVHH
jgi:diguanylate cyclase